MKFSRLTSILMISGLMVLLPLNIVNAAEGDPTSDATVSFIENNTVTPPVDPIDPSLPGGGGGTGMNGPLSIDYISTLDFGTGLMVSSNQETYNTTVAIPYLQVSDLRGLGTGWHVTAVCSNFKQNDEASLRGAEILLTGATAISANPDLAPPTPSASVVLKTDGVTVSPIITASNNTGRGTWVNRWYTAEQSENTNVQLKVPAAAATVGAHKAEITWTLTDAPL